ncbi:MAG: alginate lyase family protein [Planctomycetota bacterium]
MQSVRWYVRRLQSMSLAEIGWRCTGKLRDAVDGLLLPRRQRPPKWNRIVGNEKETPLTRFGILTGQPQSLDHSEIFSDVTPWRERVIEQADETAGGMLHLFDAEYQYPGEPIDWDYEPKARLATPKSKSTAIDYRDYSTTGDCKFVWEPNRHHHFVVMARAYRWTGDGRYAEAVADQWDSWLEQCPYGYGMNWRSPLELGIRIINWAWTMELLDGAEALTLERRRKYATSIHRHLWEITRKYSRYSSANNHLIGEAAGVFIGSSFFRGLRQAEKWRRESHAILSREMLNQNRADGTNGEQAIGYQLFVSQFLLLAGLVGRRTGMDFAQSYWDRLESMLDFLAALSDGGPLPMFGDSDDGYVLDLGDRENPVDYLLACGANLFDRADFAARVDVFPESAWWLFGDEGREQFNRQKRNGRPISCTSRAFEKGGYYLLQRGSSEQADSVSVVFDAGELGFGSIAAHGHADALSFTLRVGGEDVLVDPGTYDYFTYPMWRQYFRSTRAHNTLVIDEQDQSVMQGSFLWGERARSRLVRWEPTDHGGSVVAEHDGYKRFSDPVIHRRTVTLDGFEPTLTVSDEIRASRTHTIDQYWHFADKCQVQALERNRWLVSFPQGSLTMEFDPSVAVSLVKGCEDPIGGWMSRGYHQKCATTALRSRCTREGSIRLETRMMIRIQQASRLATGSTNQTQTASPAMSSASS